MNEPKANEASSPGDDAAVVTSKESKLEDEGGPSRSASVRPAPFTPVRKKIERLGVGVFGLERIRPRRRPGGRQGQGASATSTKVRHYMSSEVSAVRAE